MAPSKWFDALGRLPTNSIYHQWPKYIQPLANLPPVDLSGEVLPKPEVVVDRRMRHKGDKSVTEVLVKWSGTTDEENTWEML